MNALQYFGLGMAAGAIIYILSAIIITAIINKRETKTMATTKQQLLDLGWEDKGDILVRYSNPRIGWKPADGTLIVGYHECPYKCYNVEQIMNAIQ